MGGGRGFQAEKMVRAEARPEGKQDLGCPGKGCVSWNPESPATAVGSRGWIPRAYECEQGEWVLCHGQQTANEGLRTTET